MASSANPFITLDQIITTSDDLIEIGKKQNEFDELDNLFAFMGFDVEKTLLSLTKKARSKDPAEFKRHIMTLLVLYVTRGSNLKKILEKTGQEGKLRIEAALNFFDGQIFSNLADAKTNGPEILTLPRIAAVFCHWVAQIMKVIRKTPLLAPGKSLVDYDCPHFFLFPGAMPLLRPGDMAGHKLWMLDFDKIVRAKAYADKTWDEDRAAAMYDNIMRAVTNGRKYQSYAKLGKAIASQNSEALLNFDSS